MFIEPYVEQRNYMIRSDNLVRQGQELNTRANVHSLRHPALWTGRARVQRSLVPASNERCCTNRIPTDALLPRNQDRLVDRVFLFTESIGCESTILNETHVMKIYRRSLDHLFSFRVQKLPVCTG